MKLRKLTTQNFKRVGSGEFAFSDGVNVIVGDNAAGKSTLLRAVSVALYGVAALPGVAADVATWGTQSWGLLLEFEHAGHAYAIARDHRTAQVTMDGEMVANGNRPSTQYIETLLNRTMKDFNLLSNSRQGETTYALNYGAAALQREVERLSGADTIEKIIGAAKTLRTKLDAEVAASSDFLLSDDEVAALTAKIQESEKQAEMANTEVDMQDSILAEPEPDEPEVDVKALRRAREAYVLSLKEHENYAKAKADLEAQVAEVGNEIAIESLQSDIGAWKEQVTKLADRKLQYEKACDQATHLDHQIGEIEIPEVDFEALAEQTEVNLSAQEAAKLAAWGEMEKHSGEVKHLKKHLKDGVCPTCGTVLKDDVEEVKAKLKQAEYDLRVAGEAHEPAAKAVEKLRKEVAQLRKQATSKAVLTEQKEKLEAQFGAVDYGDWDDERDQAKFLAVAESLKEAEGELRSADEHNKAVRKLHDRLAKLQEPESVEAVAPEDLAAAEKAWEAHMTALMVWKTNQATAQERKASALTQVVAAKAALNQAVKALKAHGETHARVALKKERTALAERLVSFLRERREFYLTQVWDSILGTATRFLESSTEGWITGLSMKDGAFLFEEHGGAWVPAVEASGAQGAFLGVALRMGLARALDNDRSLMILDEPTEAMKEDNARRLMAGIGEARDQVVVVTHRTTDQGLADTVIEVGAVQ